MEEWWRPFERCGMISENEIKYLFWDRPELMGSVYNKGNQEGDVSCSTDESKSDECTDSADR